LEKLKERVGKSEQGQPPQQGGGLSSVPGWVALGLSGLTIILTILLNVLTFRSQLRSLDTQWQVRSLDMQWQSLRRDLKAMRVERARPEQNPPA
jgi:hypothetical protein